MSLDLQALETSFDLVAARGDELMDEFYKGLFEAAPAVMPLFAGTDLKRQKAMLLGTLVLLRKSLRDPDAIVLGGPSTSGPVPQPSGSSRERCSRAPMKRLSRPPLSEPCSADSDAAWLH
jgi:hypothetical protein